MALGARRLAESLGLGLIIGVVHWLLVVDRARPLWLLLTFVITVVAGAAAVAALIG